MPAIEGTSGEVTSITGTPGQIIASASTGAVTLSLATDITGVNSLASVAGQPLLLKTGTTGTALTIASATNIATFGAGIVGTTATLSSLTATRVPFAGTAGLLTDAAAFTFTSGTGALGATSFVGSGSSLTGIVTSITGTSGQVTASAATGAVTLSIPTAMTGITSITAPASTDLTLNAGTGANNGINITPVGTGTVKMAFSGASLGLILIGTANTSAWTTYRTAAAPTTDVWETYLNGSNSLTTANVPGGDSLILTVGGNLSVPRGNLTVGAGSVTTAAPNSGTAGAWKMGIRVAATVVLDTTQYVQLDVGGTLYKLAIAS